MSRFGRVLGVGFGLFSSVGGCCRCPPEPAASDTTPLIPAPPPPPVPTLAPSKEPEAVPGVPDTGEPCFGKDEREVLEPVDCASGCKSFRIQWSRCENGSWQRQPPIEPSCACKPALLPTSLQACRASDVVITPAIGAPNDGCRAHFACGADALDVACDGENDGTGTSLCTCHRNGYEVRSIGSLWKGEGIDTCTLAAERCLGADR